MKHLLTLLLLLWIPLASAEAPAAKTKPEKAKEEKPEKKLTKEERWAKIDRIYDGKKRERHCPHHSEHEHNFNGKGVGHFVHGNGKGLGHYLCSGNGTGANWWHRTGGDGFFISNIMVDGKKHGYEYRQKFVDTYNNIKINELNFCINDIKKLVNKPDAVKISVSIHYGDKKVYVNYANKYKPHTGLAFHNSHEKVEPKKDNYRLIIWPDADEKVKISSKVLDAAYKELKKEDKK